MKRTLFRLITLAALLVLILPAGGLAANPRSPAGSVSRYRQHEPRQ